MANNIVTAKAYATVVDELYRTGSLTSDLTMDAKLVRSGANAGELLIPSVVVSGLGAYDRNEGYKSGDASTTWQTVKCNYDRGVKLNVDVMDDAETGMILTAELFKALVNDHAIPEGDAYTFAAIAAKAGLKATAATYADGAAVLTAIAKGYAAMSEKQVPLTDRILYITPTLHTELLAMDTTKSRELIGRFAKIVEVPQGMFNTAVTLNDGSETFDYTTSGKDINFMIVHKKAVLKCDKHTVSDKIPAEQNQSHDADLYKYRHYGLVDVLANKVNGIYLSTKA